jgi:nucleoside transporter
MNIDQPDSNMATQARSDKPVFGGGTFFRLSFMMLLQYAIWGAWLPLLYTFLSKVRGFDDAEIGYMFMAGGVGALFGPFIAGQIADRWFNTERFLGVSHLIGAVLMLILVQITSFWGFLGFALAYSIVYSPTLALTNSLSFHHLSDRDRQFGWVRLWGTIGWIAVGIGIGQWLYHAYSPADLVETVNTAKLAVENASESARVGLEATLQTASEALHKAQAEGMYNAFYVAAILGFIMGVYCLTLPRTPPQRGQESFATGEAIKEASRNPLLVLFLIAIPVSMIHQFYFQFTAVFLGNYQAQAGEVNDAINGVFGVGGGGLMTIGQIAEVIVLMLIPLVAKRFSRKTLLGIGLVAYAARMFLFAYVDWLSGSVGVPVMVTLIAGVALHGLCFGCFIFVAFMIVDEECTRDVKASAQNLFNLIIVGIGIVVGSYVAAKIGTIYTSEEGVKDWQGLFTIPMYAAVVCLALLAAFYPGKSAMARIREKRSITT